MFIETVKKKGLNYALELSIPNSAKQFIKTTFSYIQSEKIHIIASAFAFGRETIIPKMFISILNKLKIKEKECPTFYYYIKRHIEVDGDLHGPMSMECYLICAMMKLRKYQRQAQYQKKPFSQEYHCGMVLKMK